MHDYILCSSVSAFHAYIWRMGYGCWNAPWWIASLFQHVDSSHPTLPYRRHCSGLLYPAIAAADLHWRNFYAFLTNFVDFPWWRPNTACAVSDRLSDFQRFGEVTSIVGMIAMQYFSVLSMAILPTRSKSGVFVRCWKTPNISTTAAPQPVHSFTHPEYSFWNPCTALLLLCIACVIIWVCMLYVPVLHAILPRIYLFFMSYMIFHACSIIFIKVVDDEVEKPLSGVTWQTGLTISQISASLGQLLLKPAHSCSSYSYYYCQLSSDFLIDFWLWSNRPFCQNCDEWIWRAPNFEGILSHSADFLQISLNFDIA